MDDKIFTSELNKPELNEETLAHYGVLGMKWGIRKNPDKAVQKASKKSGKIQKKINKTNKKYLKAAKKANRLLFKKHDIEKMSKLRGKVDVLSSKKRKWDNTATDIIRKEYDRRNKVAVNSLAKDIKKVQKETGKDIVPLNKIKPSDKTNKAVKSLTDYERKQYVRDATNYVKIDPNNIRIVKKKKPSK